MDTEIALVGMRAPEFDVPQMLDVPGGLFTMGSTEYGDEAPIRTVTLSPYRIGKYPVTVSQFKAFIEATQHDVHPELTAILTDEAKQDHPVTYVSHSDAVTYLKWLSETTGRSFRLPTEAEWERAARGANAQRFPFGNDGNQIAKLVEQGAVVFNSNAGTRPVHRGNANESPSGALDMAGNVWEWVADWYAEGYNPKDIKDPKGPDEGQSRVLRGGSWSNDLEDDLRGSHRDSLDPSNQTDYAGFRPVGDI